LPKSKAGPSAEIVSPPVKVFTTVVIAGLVLASGAAILLGWLSEEVLESDTASFDAHFRDLIHARASPSFTSILQFFTHVGSVAVLGCLLIATVVVFWICKWRREAMLLAVTMAGAGVLNAALKFGFHRARPSPYFGITAPHSFSYPSGHAMFSFAFFAAIAVLSTPRIGTRWARALVWLAAAILVALIGFSRIYLGVHYPSDVLAGYLTAFIWVMAVGLGDHFYEHRRSQTRQGRK